MKKLVLIALLLIASFVNAQILEPVKWSTAVEKISATEYNLVATATIDSGWHLYSQNVPEGGPIPTAFEFENNDAYSLVNKAIEEKGHTVNDPIFEMQIKFFENKAVFKQHIKVTDKSLTKVVAEVEFMVCDDARCLPPTYVDLNFNLE